MDNTQPNRYDGRPHEKLEVYRIAHALALRVHALRQYKAEYLHYLARSYGSAEETIEHLRYLLESGSASHAEDECRSLLGEYAVLCRKLFNYMRSVEKKHDPRRG